MNFCPVHFLTSERCGLKCLHARVALAALTMEMDDYFRELYGLPPSTQGRAAAELDDYFRGLKVAA